MKLRPRTLGRREAEELIAKIKEAYPSFPLEPGVVERVYVEDANFTVYTFDGMPCLWHKGKEPGDLIPIIQCLDEKAGLGLGWIKGYLIIDKGAALALARGANLMVPGVKSVEGSFASGDIVAAVYAEGGSKAPVMVGRAVMDSSDLARAVEEGGRGVAVRRLHYVGDKVWEAARVILVRRRGARS